MSEFWHRYWQRLAGARPRPEPNLLKAAAGEVPVKPDDGRRAAIHPDDCEHSWGSLHEPDHRLYWVRQCTLCHAVDWADLDAEIGKLLAGKDEIDQRKDVIVADLRKAVAEAERIIAGRDARIAALTDRAEQAEATAASLRDGSAALSRRVADAVAALRQIADAPPGTTHATKTALAAAGLAALSGDAREVPAGAHDGAEGVAGGFLP